MFTSGGWDLTGNAGTTPGTNFLGTTDNQALQLWVDNSRAGVGEALAGSVDPVLRVQQSSPAAQGVVGVVFSRATVTPTEKEGEALDEGGAVIDVLLDAPDVTSGLAPVLVTLR